MSVNRRLNDVLVDHNDQELETVTCTGIRAAPVDGLNFMQADFKKLSGGGPFFTGYSYVY